MLRIGIELNGVVRDINTQILKYYKKDINTSFDDENFDLNVIDVSKKLDFGSKKKRNDFLYIDYPYEVFGCARVMSRNLATKINNWMLSFENNEEDVELIFFSTNEMALTIQSTYYFLSKIGCRVRKMFFPQKSNEVWDACDVVITQDKNIVLSKPQNKRVVLIRKNDNEDVVGDADFSYDGLGDVIDDEFFLKKLDFHTPKTYLLRKIFNKFKKVFK